MQFCSCAPRWSGGASQAAPVPASRSRRGFHAPLRPLLIAPPRAFHPALSMACNTCLWHSLFVHDSLLALLPTCLALLGPYSSPASLAPLPRCYRPLHFPHPPTVSSPLATAAAPPNCPPPLPALQVFVIEATGEVFRSYEAFLQKKELYGQPVWSCKYSGRGGMSLEEAQEAEKKALAALASVSVQSGGSGRARLKGQGRETGGHAARNGRPVCCAGQGWGARAASPVVEMPRNRLQVQYLG